MTLPSNDEQAEQYLGQMCGRCYCETDQLHTPNCAEKPELLKGQPIGMYHCTDCGAMVMAGVPHPPVCKLCLDKAHPGMDGAA